MTETAQAGSAEALWRISVAKVLKGADMDTLVTRTRDGLPIAPLSPPSNAGPGPWRDMAQAMRIDQRIDDPDPVSANQQARAAIVGGAGGLTLAMAGAVSARGFGLAPDDLPAVLDGIALDKVSLRLDPAPFDDDAADALMALVAAQGLAPEALALDLGIDPPGDMARTGRFGSGRGRPEASLARVRAIRDRGFTAPAMRADGRPHHEAGGSEAQELAAVLAGAVAALRTFEPDGLDSAQRALSVTLAVDADLLLTIAKLRAMRRLWACVEQACGLTARPLRLHVETAWRMMARRDPHTNLLRTTLASAAAIMGGADSLTVLPFTSALGRPDAFAQRLAHNTPLVLLEEAHLGRVADPAAGSGTIEALTGALCGEAWRLFQGIEQAGGLAAALAAGSWQAAVATMRDRRMADLAAGRATIVGVTAFVDPGEAPPALRPTAATDALFPALPSWREAAAFEDSEARP